MTPHSTPLLAASFALITPFVTSAQAPDAAFRAALVEKNLRAAGKVTGRPDRAYTMEERMKYWHVPGISLAIIEDNQIVFARGYNLTEFGGTKRVDTTTLFQAGSISKPVLATAALKLVEQGRSIGDMQWLVGCWERAQPNGRIVESWSAPASGVMAGISTSIRDTTRRVTERLRLFYRGDTLIYEASPARQPRNEFKSTKIASDELVFADPEHDFPQKIVYRRIGADSLLARVEGDRAGRMQPIDYPFKRIACD